MRELDLLHEFLEKRRQRILASAFAQLRVRDTDLIEVKALAKEAEFCISMQSAIKVLANDPGRFIEEFLK